MRVPLPAAMITMFDAIRLPTIKALIIGGCLVFLSACSALRLGYPQAPQLAYWYFDGYVDFTPEQTPKAREALQKWFAWHRATQLPDYADWLAQLQLKAPAAVTPQQVCRLSDDVRARIEPALAQALPLVAPWLPSLSAAQLKHIEARYAKGNEEFRSEYARVDAEERRARQWKRALQRYEDFYGRLGEEQRAVVQEGLAGSPFEPDLVLAERRARQAETVQGLRAIGADGAANPERTLAALRALAQRMQQSPRADYRAYEARFAQHQCAVMARVHNLATPAQRESLRRKFKGWEDDLRALINPDANATEVAPG